MGEEGQKGREYKIVRASKRACKSSREDRWQTAVCQCAEKPELVLVSQMDLLQATLRADL